MLTAKFSFKNVKPEQWKKLAALSLLTLLVIEPAVAHAAKATTISGAIDEVTKWMTGAVGKSLGVAAVMVMGLMALFGKLEWGFAGKVILGLALIYGASELSHVITGT